MVGWRGGGPVVKWVCIACFNTWGSAFISALLTLSGGKQFFGTHTRRVDDKEASSELG